MQERKHLEAKQRSQNALVSQDIYFVSRLQALEYISGTVTIVYVIWAQVCDQTRI